MTGAPVPDGADCVCMIEEIQSEPDGAYVGVPRSMSAGENVRYPGEDVTVGQVLLEPGTELGPAELGVLASQGYRSVVVFPRPRVGVMSTGNELSDSGEPLHGGEIRDMNRPMLLASLRRSGFDAVDLGIVRDDLESITRAYESAIESCDAVISTGGVSVGDVDHVKAVIISLSAGRARWMQVAIKPGKPFTFGVAGERAVPLFGLPGNPVSTLVGFELYVRPSLRLLAGHPSYDRPTVNAVLDCPLTRRPDGRTHLVHVALEYDDEGRLHITNATRHGSHLVSAIMGANGLAWVPDGVGLEPGTIVRTLMLGDVGLATTTSGAIA
jgi:molybdenum cofactor synthesis domain-containing protein